MFPNWVRWLLMLAGALTAVEGASEDNSRLLWAGVLIVVCMIIALVADRADRRRKEHHP
jgi:hypothetical protein